MAFGETMNKPFGWSRRKIGWNDGLQPGYSGPYDLQEGIFL